MTPDMPPLEPEVSAPPVLSSANSVAVAVGVPIRVAIADDHPVVREGLKRLISQQADFEIVAEAGDGEEAFKAAAQFGPEILIMDMLMPGVSGVEAARQIKQAHPAVKVIGLSICEETEKIRELMSAGAHGFVAKRAAADELVIAMRAVHKGGVHLDPRVRGAVVGGDELSALGPCEAAILRLTAAGCSNREIARRLGLNIEAVKAYKAAAIEKAALRGRPQVLPPSADDPAAREEEQTGHGIT